LTGSAAIAEASKRELSAGYQPRVNVGADEGLGDGVPVGDGNGLIVALGVTDGDGVADADTVAGGVPPEGERLSVAAAALPPITAEATVRTVPVLITTHFPTRMRIVIPANDSS
jgi:hypothetical protein